MTFTIEEILKNSKSSLSEIFEKLDELEDMTGTSIFDEYVKRNPSKQGKEFIKSLKEVKKQ